MALFSFTDIRFGTAARRVGLNGRLAGSQYDSNLYRYPIDLGEADKGHYMVFHINVQTKTEFSSPLSFDTPDILNSPNRVTSGLANITDATSWLREQTDTAGLEAIEGLQLTESTRTAIETVRSNVGQGLDFVGELAKKVSIQGARTIQRTAETIALYMPDTLNFGYDQSYDGISLSSPFFDILNAGKDVMQAGSSIIDLAKGGQVSVQNIMKSIPGNLTPFAVDYLSRFAPSNIFGSNFGRFALASLGVARNPLLEVIYTSPSLRKFQFDFLFYPRSEKEAQQVQSIIDSFTFHQSPEIFPGSGGVFLIPPSEFDIKFYYNGKENPNIPKISTCVLNSLNIDYAPSGFSAYEVPGETTPSMGKTGMPVGIRLQLNFTETQIVTKNSLRPDSFASQAESVYSPRDENGEVIYIG